MGLRIEAPLRRLDEIRLRASLVAVDQIRRIRSSLTLEKSSHAEQEQTADHEAEAAKRISALVLAPPEGNPCSASPSPRGGPRLSAKETCSRTPLGTQEAMRDYLWNFSGRL
jgi:hypothetical protein